MKKVKDDSLLLFVVDEFGDLQPNLEIIQGKKERIENDTGLSIPREEPKHNNLQDTNAVVYGQESGALRAENNRTLDLSLSKDLSNLRSFRSSLFSSTASEDGTKDTKEQESQRTTSKRNYSNGDTTRSTDRSSVLSNSVSASIKPSIQRFDKRGNAGGLVRERGYSYGNTVSSRTNDFTDDRQSSTGSRRDALQRVSRKDRQDIGLSLFEERRLGQEVNQEHREHNELKSLERTDTRIRERNDGDSRGDKVDFSLDKEPEFGSLKAKFRKNIEAIKLLKELEADNDRFATKEEQTTLSLFSGWGGISYAFDSQNKEWKNEYEDLVRVLDEAEYKAARNSTQDAFYTPKIIIDTIYKGLDNLGFNKSKEAKDIFEPSAGIGNFLAYSKNYSQNYNFTCTELDNISARILKKLYPNQKIRNQSFETYNFVREYDAFIGNPPFGQKKILDNNLYLKNLSVHNYFLTKSIDKLKQDGIAAFVVSRYFLDSKNTAVREYISENSTFLGAVRLPNNLFSKIANTEVSTDILFFKKGKDENLNKKWLKSVAYYDSSFSNGFSEDEIKDFRINEYYKENPQNILGKLKLVSSQFGFSLECVDDGRNLQKALDNFVASLPKDVYKYHATKIKDEIVIVNKESSEFIDFEKNLNNIKQGNYFVYKNEVYFKISSSSEELIMKKPNLNQQDKIRIIKLVELRDTFNELIRLEKSELNDENIEPFRRKLNTLYDDFVKKEGFLNREANKRAFKEDVEANKILALEKNYNAGISKTVALKEGVEAKAPSATKSDIFYKRTIAAKKELKISTPKEALMASINEYGYLSLTFLEQNLDMKLEESLKSLLDEKLIFINHKNSQYELASKYLSGNVKQKYKEVEELIKQGNNEHLHTNLESLKEVLPADLKASDISASIGATWIPIKYYKEFFEEKFSLTEKDFDISLNKYTGEWHFQGLRHNVSAYTRTLYETNRMDIFKLATHALRRNPIKIADTIEDFDSMSGKYKTKKILNAKETALANSKLEKLKNDFTEWIYKDYDRRIDLEKIYNEKFNTNIEPKYDGSHLTLPDFNQNIILKPHQKNAIYRAIQERAVLFDHQVGAGKTLVSICSLMEQKRMGLINKPLIVVPNHIIRQWNDEFYNAYPNANILVADKKDLEKNNREQFFSKIATNEYDAIIMTHSQFKLLPAPLENEIKIINEAIESLQESIDLKQKEENTKSYSVKQMEKRLDDLKTKLNKLLNKDTKSKSTDFSELGIDALVIDEAHEFKNLLITTSMGDISGLGNLNGSQKALDLYTKTDYIHSKNHKLYFLTGTPISNSITELYTLQRYMQPEILKEKGIQSFDSWASIFGEVSNAWELDSSGINYKIVARFNKFKNVPELANMYKSVADIVSNTDIMKYQKDFVPKLYNDKPINEVVPRSEEVARYIGIQDENGLWNEGSIVWRMENQDKDISKNNLLACTTDARKAGLDYRLINPYAEDFKDSKINKLVENVYNEYIAWQDDKGTQLIFCDLSTPKKHSQKVDIQNISIDKDTFTNINEELEEYEENKSLDELLARNSSFDVYSDILKKLVAKGIKQDEIRFIHDAKTDLQKSQLFNDMNTGKARVLIGSTQKMGAGTNVQRKVIALHHLDCPWRPSDLEQRIGRVIRQGNEIFMRDPLNFRVKEFRYATERTYDARMWQVIENKARSIEQFRKAGANTRTLDDISSAAADAAQMKAEATGNPFILMQVQLSNDLKQEELLYSNFKRELFNNEEDLKNFKAESRFLNEENERLTVFKEIIEKNHISNFKGSLYEYNEDGILRNIKNFSILKNDDSKENRHAQELVKNTFESNIKLITSSYEKEIEILRYRGLVISGERIDKNTLVFYVNTEDKKLFLEPENLIYKKKDNDFIPLENYVSFDGFVKRLNNFYMSIDKLIDENLKSLTRLNNDIKELESITGENALQYTRKEYLEALREDNKAIIEEIEKTSKNKSYKSTFTPKSSKILQDLNKSKDVQELEK